MRIGKLRPDHVLAGFDCGSEELIWSVSLRFPVTTPRRPTWLKVDCRVIVSRMASDVFDRVKHVCPNDRLAARSLRAG